MRATKLHQIATLCVGLSLPLLGAPSHARAANAPTENANELEAKAVEAYDAGRYVDAIELFKAAFDANGNPNYLYNIGRVYEESGQLEQAIIYYDRFIHAEGVGLDTRMVASERLGQLKKITGQADKETPPPAQPDDTTSPPPKEPVEESPPDGGRQPDEQPDERPGKALVISGSILLGVGAPVAVAGAVLGGMALGTNDRLESEQLADPIETQKNGRNQALAADILVPVGAALAVTGIALLVVHGVRKSRSRAGRTAIAPLFGRTQAGVSLVGRF